MTAQLLKHTLQQPINNQYVTKLSSRVKRYQLEWPEVQLATKQLTLIQQQRLRKWPTYTLTKATNKQQQHRLAAMLGQEVAMLGQQVQMEMGAEWHRLGRPQSQPMLLRYQLRSWHRNLKYQHRQRLCHQRCNPIHNRGQHVQLLHSCPTLPRWSTRQSSNLH